MIMTRHCLSANVVVVMIMTLMLCISSTAALNKRHTDFRTIPMYSSESFASDVMHDDGTSLSPSDASDQYRALAELYTSTNGDYWYNNTGWMMSDNVCEWHGILCYPAHNGHVIDISLINNNLTGSLPCGDFTKLIYLRRIYLALNKIGGSLCPSWDRLVDLTELYLIDNYITGELPESYMAWTKLKYMMLSFNLMTGPLPSNYSALTSMTCFWGNDNSFSGPLPASWSSLTRMESLSASGDFTGELPRSWSQMSSLSALYLEGGQLTGGIPLSWSLLSNLSYFSLVNMQFSGEYPAILPHFFVYLNKLHSIVITNSSFTGKLPDEWCNMTSIDVINLSHNRLEGVVPESWCMLSLSTLDLHENQLTILSCKESNILSIDISQNKLIGVSIKSEVLQYLNVSHNSILAASLVLDDNPAISILDISHNLFDVKRFSSWCDSVRVQPSLIEFHAVNTSIDAMPCAASLTKVNLLDIRESKSISKLPDCNDEDFASARFMAPAYFYASNALSLTTCSNYEKELALSTYTPQNYLYSNFTGKWLGMPRYLVYGGLSSTKGSTYACPSISTTKNIPALLDPSFYRHMACACETGYYGFPPNCTPCHDGAQCDAPGTICPRAKAGRWAVYENAHSWSCKVTKYLTCDYIEYGVTACDNNDTKAFGVNTCRHGHAGRMCAGCADGYYHTGTTCKECENTWMLIIMLIVGVVGMYVYALVGQLSKSGAECSVALFYLQVFAQLWCMRLPMSPSSGLLTGVLHFASLNLGGPECYGLSYETQFFAIASLPVVLVIGGFITYLVMVFLGHPTDHARYKATSSTVYVLMSFMIPVVLWSLRTLFCDNDDYLLWSPWVQCPTGHVRAVAYVLLMAYLVIIPLSIFFILYKNRTQSSILAFFTAPYKEQYWWYELVELVKRLVFVLATTVGGYEHSAWFAIIMLALFTSCLFSVLQLSPHKSQYIKTLYVVVHAIAGVLYMWATVFFQPGLPDVGCAMTTMLLLGYSGCVTVIGAVTYTKTKSVSNEPLKQRLMSDVSY